MKKNNTEIQGKMSFLARMKIRAKLIIIISLIIVISMTGMIFLATYFFSKDYTVKIYQNNLKIAMVISQKVNADFQALVEKMKIMGTVMQQEFRTNQQKEMFIDLFFKNDKNFVYLGIYEKNGNSLKDKDSMFSPDFLQSQRMDRQTLINIGGYYKEDFISGFNGEAMVINVSKNFKIPMLAIVIPFYKNNYGSYSSILAAYIKLDRFLVAFKKGDGPSITYMVNKEGDIIGHPDTEIVLKHGNYKNQKIVQDMLLSNIGNGFSMYKDQFNKVHLGSFSKVGFAGAGVIATVEKDKELAAVYKTQRQNIYIMVIVLNLAILIVYFFGKTLTTPIIKLVDATKQIEDGNFIVNIQPASEDEIGQLTRSFVEMGKGLQEREKMKEAFGKFVNKEIAEQVLRGEIKLGGERKVATVFFSDIRSFTAISEKLEPEEVVEFLNEYMTRMVNCVNATNGVVDKYIGDAVMAVWGAPVSYGNDTENAINGALMMRKELIIFNKGRGGEKKPIIKIGCGINTGPLLAGQIGSEERMEYTVIGDTVNLASRIESLNKPFGTDILISQDTYDRVKHIFNVEQMQKIKVKGKTEPQQIYAVLGRRDNDSAPKSLEELRALLGIEMKGKPTSEAGEEVKYEIIE